MTTQLPLFTLPEVKPDPVQQAQIDLEPYRERSIQAGFRAGFVHVWAAKQDTQTAITVYQLLTVSTKNKYFESRLNTLKQALHKEQAA